MRLIGYVRVSSTSQAENTSLDSQRDEIVEYCQKHGHELVDIFTDIGSGSSTKTRKGLQSALADLTQNDGLIVAKADRLGRNTKDILTLIDDHIAPAKKDLILIDLNIDTATPHGRLYLTLSSSFAEFERALINERTDKGRKIRMRDGKPMGAPKFGEMVKDIDKTDKTRPANESEQKIIQIMIRHRKAGKGYQAIANLLNKKGYPTKQGKTWYYPTVKNILDRAGIP